MNTNGSRYGSGSGQGSGRLGNGGSSGTELPELPSLSGLRSANAARVLELLRVAGEGGISRLELAEGTGLTPQAVSKITARLRGSGLVAEAGYRASTGGKPRTVLRLVPPAAHAVGLHLDRDELTVVLLDLAGVLVGRRVVPLDLGAGADAVMEAVAVEVESLLAASDPAGALSAGPLSGQPSATLSAGPPSGQPSATLSAGPLSEPPSAGRLSAGEPGSVPAPAPAAAPSPGPAGSAAGTGPAPWLGEPGPAPQPSGPGPDNRPSHRVLGVGVAMPGPLDHASGVPHRVTGFPQWDGFPLRDALAERLGLPVALDKDTNAAALGLALRTNAAALGLALQGNGDSFAYLHLGTGLGAGLVLGGGLYRGARTGAGEFGHQVVQLDGPSCGCGRRGCIEALCLAAVADGDLAAAARILGVGAANLVELLDIDRVLLGGRVVEAAAGTFVRGVGEQTPVPVELANGGPHTVAEGAAQLVLAPVFGRAEAAFSSPLPPSRTGQKIR
ncbi:ROK family protein [Streptomyces sp. NPDC058685]|uniref:ROK family transcriptional regulator n=1 Tax=Streptomyces sp. NPDC058685 TaxID=3346598 RepID=UPI00365FE278